MLHALKQRREDEQGFTLIELMVVVLIIAILLAIAIPTFLGARERAQDRAAQSNLRNAYTAAKAVFTDNEDYNDTLYVTATTLQGSEPTLCFYTLDVADGSCDVAGETRATSSADPKQVHYISGDLDATTAAHEMIILSAVSKSGKCFSIKEVIAPAGSGGAVGGEPAGTFYKTFTPDAGDDCVAVNTAANTWKDKF